MLVPPELLFGDEDYVLCQDCGRVALFTDARHRGVDRCVECGGEFCGCRMCMGVARLSLQFQARSEYEKADENPAAFNGPEKPE